MKLVSDWRQSLRWFSVQAMALQGATAAAWLALPAEWRETFPAEWMTACAVLLMALDIARDMARQMIAERIDLRMAEGGKLYPASERATQGIKLAEAQAVLAGGNAGPYLTAAAKARGDTVKALAGKVVRKAETEAAAAATAEGERVAAYAAIDKARSVKAVIEAM